MHLSLPENAALTLRLPAIPTRRILCPGNKVGLYEPKLFKVFSVAVLLAQVGYVCFNVTNQPKKSSETLAYPVSS
jgi:hypothetical protein